MGLIGNYPDDASVTDSDKVLGVDSSGSTVLTPMSSVRDYVQGGGNVVPNSLQAGTGTSWAWQTWTPTYSGITVGNGTVTAKYTQIGKSVQLRWHLKVGSTTVINDGFAVSLPVAAHADYGTLRLQSIGTISGHDAGTAVHHGFLRIDLSTTLMQIVWEANSVNSSSTTTLPFAEASGDDFSLSGTYEAA